MRYVLYLLLLILVQLITWIVTPLLPLFAEYRVGGCNNNSYQAEALRLPLWLSWFDTRDNSLIGDGGWDYKHNDGYWSQVGWLYRNSLYGFKWTVLSLPESHPDAWQFKREYKYIWLNLGWMLDNPEQGKLMFQFSIRRAKSKL